MKQILTILALFLWPTLSLAQMSAEEFERFTTGKTLYYSQNGQEYGVERYKENRQVEWSFLDGECRSGVWYKSGDFICFSYEGWDLDQCWSFEETPNGLIATFSEPDAQGARTQYFAYEKDEPMICFGPDTGV